MSENIDKNESAEAPVEGIVGELAPPEMAQLQQLQAQVNSCYNTIGQMEVRKAAILGRVGAIEAQGQQVMNGIAKRCGIAEGTPWQITPDNKVQTVLPSNVKQFPTGAAKE